MTPLTRERRPLAMLCRKVTSTWEKTSAAHCLGLGIQEEGFRKPSGPPEGCDEGVPLGSGVGTGVATTVGCGDA